MKSYVVRIYRSEKDDTEKLVGTVEDVGTGTKKGFDSFDKLRDMLNPHANKEANNKKGGGEKIRFSRISSDSSDYIFYLSSRP